MNENRVVPKREESWRIYPLFMPIQVPVVRLRTENVFPKQEPPSAGITSSAVQIAINTCKRTTKTSGSHVMQFVQMNHILGTHHYDATSSSQGAKRKEHKHGWQVREGSRAVEEGVEETFTPQKLKRGSRPHELFRVSVE